ncbi:RagB/SusD family nutrient uptake outer membrane protein [Robertkochia solimangrovi]|uniref:RagB/SusD family nutrient uptake outer membrane protein n=1 Tax=Robertkochia solimangrovi TaxID=2213046 RepID=UPI00117EE325|nr:RagB/SusD family nutrient uptake outer membrane protein [Robertkochia solimangrovi]TRZ41878.1 RagB/SusD family nutrient uptake outer membrane protein [Robertkochia solimangrovi]
MEKSIYYIRHVVAIILFQFLLVSCNDFLDEAPSVTRNAAIQTAADIEALLNNYSSFNEESNLAAIYGHDDFALPINLYDRSPRIFTMSLIQNMTWDIDNIVLQNNNFWNSEYTKIFTANVILESIDEVDATDAERTQLSSEAHFIRAYSYFQLVNTFCMPYNLANAGELGLPLKTLPNYEQSLDRNNLGQTYDFIEDDIQIALDLDVDIDPSDQKIYRANTAAVNALAARFYLAKQDYEQALQYAEIAIANHPGLLDYNTDMRYGMSESYVLDSGTSSEQTVEVEYPYTHDNQTDPSDRLNWKEYMYFRTLYNGSWWFVPSQELLDLYDHENDLRYRYHMVEGYSYNRGMTNPSLAYPGYVFFYKSHLPNGPTIAEMYLLKAECQARTGDLSGALETINILYMHRTLPGTPLLSASGAEDVLSVVLEERRREMPFTQRFFDIKRFSVNETTSDDVVLERTFYPYTATGVSTGEPLMIYELPLGSRRYAVPIPAEEIQSSQGQIEQNPY